MSLNFYRITVRIHARIRAFIPFHGNPLVGEAPALASTRRMMMGKWVYKEDGTRQCGEGHEITIQEMEKDLARIVGERNIINRKKGQLPWMFPDLCGSPNGHVNMYELTPEGFLAFDRGIVGHAGFQVWVYDKPAPKAAGLLSDVPETPFPWSAKEALPYVAHASSNPVLIRELIGYHLRVIKPGEAVTMEYMWGRVNISVDENNEIKQISFF